MRRIERNIAYAQTKQQGEVIKNVAAYLNKAITEDLGLAWDIQRKQKAKQKKQQAKKIKVRETQAEQAHMKRLAEMGDEPLNTLLNRKKTS